MTSFSLRAVGGGGEDVTWCRKRFDYRSPRKVKKEKKRGGKKGKNLHRRGKERKGGAGLFPSAGEKEKKVKR